MMHGIVDWEYASELHVMEEMWRERKGKRNREVDSADSRASSSTGLELLTEQDTTPPHNGASTIQELAGSRDAARAMAVLDMHKIYQTTAMECADDSKHADLPEVCTIHTAWRCS